MCLETKRNSNRRPLYIRSLRQYLALFAKGRDDIPIHSITVHDVDAWFAARREAPATMASNLGRLSALFSFSVRRGYTPENPCDRIERPIIERSAPEILTLEEIRTAMEFAFTRGQRFSLWLMLAMLVGVRRAELGRLTKDQVASQLSQRLLIVDAAASKVRQRRIIQIPSEIIGWIEIALQVGGELPLTEISVRRWLRRLRNALGKSKWTQDILRHTALSYMIAHHGDISRVARESGNSPGILMTHYYGLVTPAESEALRNAEPQWTIPNR